MCVMECEAFHSISYTYNFISLSTLSKHHTIIHKYTSIILSYPLIITPYHTPLSYPPIIPLYHTPLSYPPIIPLYHTPLSYPPIIPLYHTLHSIYPTPQQNEEQKKKLRVDELLQLLQRQERIREVGSMAATYIQSRIRKVGSV